MAQYVYLWEFVVLAGRQAEFERHYGPEGTWVSLFRRAPGYIGSRLLRDRSQPLRYITIDRWQTLDDYRAFRERLAHEYEELDRRCAGLTTHETPLGEFSD